MFSFRIKAWALTTCWTSKARDLNWRLLAFLSSSENKAPSVITIRPVSPAGSTAPRHTNKTVLIQIIQTITAEIWSVHQIQVSYPQASGWSMKTRSVQYNRPEEQKKWWWGEPLERKNAASSWEIQKTSVSTIYKWQLLTELWTVKSIWQLFWTFWCYYYYSLPDL